MKEYNQRERASIPGMTAFVVSVTVIATSLTLVSNAVAQQTDRQSFASAEECKAFYQELKDEEINKLNQRKQMMGAGMPGAIYSRKKSKITAEYESNVATCESMITSREH